MGDIYSAYITIDNPILLAILSKYKEKGLFGNNDPIFGIGEYDSWHVGKPIGIPTFDYFRDQYLIILSALKYSIVNTDKHSLNNFAQNLHSHERIF
jgi:hypothetical protein